VQEVLTYFLQVRARRPLAGRVATWSSHPCILSRMLNAEKKAKTFREGGHEPSAAVFHGLFGRATGLSVEPCLQCACHRRGTPDLSCRGTPAQIDVCDRGGSSSRTPSRGQPVGAHNFLPTDMANGAIFFVLYVIPNGLYPRGERTKPSLRPHTFQAHGALEKHFRRTAARSAASSLRSLDWELRR